MYIQLLLYKEHLSELQKEINVLAQSFEDYRLSNPFRESVIRYWQQSYPKSEM